MVEYSSEELLKLAEFFQVYVYVNPLAEVG